MSRQPDAAELREALALSEFQLRETRAELSRLIRITERSVAECASDADHAKAERDDLQERIDRARGNLCSFIQLALEYTPLPNEVLMSWLAQSELFDAEFYLRVNEDVAREKFDAAEHFVRHGINEGRAFSDEFCEQL